MEKEIPFMRGYTVFNVEQIDGLPGHFYEVIKPKHVKPLERDQKCETFIANTGADIRHGGNRAFYLITDDFVQLPDLQSFTETERYYASAAHELCHWTRHPNGLTET